MSQNQPYDGAAGVRKARQARAHGAYNDRTGAVYLVEPPADWAPAIGAGEPRRHRTRCQDRFGAADAQGGGQ